MFESGNKPVVEDTEENRAICRKYCKNCQNYRKYCLDQYQPTELFCSSGQSSLPGMKLLGCYCSGCEVYIKNHLRGGFFCVRR